jgi:hypothetical protein
METSLLKQFNAIRLVDEQAFYLAVISLTGVVHDRRYAGLIELSHLLWA